MKRYLRVAGACCVAGAVLFSAGCGGAESGGVGESTPSPTPAVQVDEGQQTIDITVQRSLVAGDTETTDDQIVQAAKDKGMTAVVNPDGSVTYTMTRAQQKQMLDETKVNVQDSIAGFVNDPENSFTAVEVNDEMSQFTVKVDAARYSPLETLYGVVFYVSGGLYQQFAGVDSDAVDVTVEYVDDATGEVLDSGSLRELLDAQAQQEQQPA